jgi:uncharacterized protein (DUF362 family)
MAKVSIVKAEDDFYAAFAKAISEIDGQLIGRGDRVLIKPNLVMPAVPDSGEITNPDVIEAVARYCLDCGAARVIIGEGPSYYIPESQLRECFTRTGVSQVAERLGIEWVLFDDHNYREFQNMSPYTPEKFRISEFAFNCDKFINLPVLKTHYLTTVTLAMKNLKGCLKREDKPLFHHRDLNRAVVELCKIVKPTVNVIDCTPKAIVRQLGEGYKLEKKESGGGLLIVSSDIVAVDAVGSTIMGIEPVKVPTVTLGAAAGLGESELIRMDIVGEEIKRLKIKVEIAREQLQRSFPLLNIEGAEGACSGCIIPLISSLLFLQERSAKLDKPMAICMGKNPDVPTDMACLLVGDCASVEGADKYNWVPGCPPSKEVLLSNLTQFMTRQER